jgi:MarR family transcriptional regulator for hemolysin
VTELLRLLARAHKLIGAALDEQLSRHGVRLGQHVLLEALWQDDGLTPGEIAGRTFLTTPTVVNTATRMEAAGLLERRPDPADRRLVRLYLTPKGRAAERPIMEARRQLADRALGGLSDTEREQLGAVLEKIIDRMTAQPERRP